MSHHARTMENVLKSVFGYDDFKNSVQRQVANAVREGSQNIIICMPPSTGKSLCFQLPAVMCKNKVAIVFSPKLYFIKNEVQYLQSRNINAHVLSLSTYIGQKKHIINDLLSDAPKIGILYCTPDMRLKAYFQDIVSKLRRKKQLSYLVFDEAHCLSKLGYDYVPSYSNIRLHKDIFDHKPKIAVTTAATKKVVQDISHILSLDKPKIFEMPVSNTKIYYDVWFLDTLFRPFEHLTSFLMKVVGTLDRRKQKPDMGAAIIYCKDEVQAEELVSKLETFGIPALACHSKLKKRARRDIENKWLRDEAYVIVATFNYGFIHQKTIRCIIYWTIPENIARYYKESSQAGNGGSPAYCRIYFSIKEHAVVKKFIEGHSKEFSPEHKRRMFNEFDKSVTYCLTTKCRQKMIAGYFGHASDNCKYNCDVCEDHVAVLIRTSKFIKYSEYVENIKYNICDINEEANQISNISSQEEETEEKSDNTIIINNTQSVSRDVHKDKNHNNKIVVPKEVDPFFEEFDFEGVLEPWEDDANNIVPSNCAADKTDTKSLIANRHIKHNPHSAINTKKVSTKERAHRNAEDALERTKASFNEASKRLIAQSLVNKCKLNKDMASLDPCGSKEFTGNNVSLKVSSKNGSLKVFGKNHTQISHEVEQRLNKQNSKSLKTKTLNRKTALNVQRIRTSNIDATFRKMSFNGESCAIAETEKQDKRKRDFIVTNVGREELPPTKRRKVELTENESIIAPQVNSHKATSSATRSAKRVKDDGNSSTTKMVEYLMKKFKLNANEISLIPQKSLTSSKSGSSNRKTNK